MPTVGIKKESLFKALGCNYSDKEFAKLCFEFGLELDEVTTEKQMIAKEQGTDQSVGASEEVIYRIDIPANRYDLLCLEGLVTGFLVFLNKISVPIYKTIKPKDGCQKITMKKSCLDIRQHLVAAILRDVNFTQEAYDSFIDLQDKLHQNIGRKRTLVSIGTHDLDTIQGPFTYDALPPKDISFVPLNQTSEFTGDGIMTLYKNHAQLKQYLPIIKDSPVYPVIYDKNGVVLSLPPIINGNHSKITLKTKNIFIEITATDLTKAKIVLDTVISSFSVHCKEKYTAEAVEVIYPDGKNYFYPELKYRTEVIDSDKAVKYIGIQETPEKVANLLSRMCLKTIVKENRELAVDIPPTRHDVLHACDIYEDIAIAYGYNNIVKTIPKTLTVGKENPLNKLSDQLRHEMAFSGFTETLTFSLCSRDDIADKLGRNIKDLPAVHVANPKTLEFQVARTDLLPGILKTLAANKKMPLPHKLFEISDVVLRDSSYDVGARNERHLCALYCNKNAGFEVIHGLVDRIMKLFQIFWDVNKTGNGYHLRAVDDPMYFPLRCAEIIYNGEVIGKMGILHPNVMTEFELNLPCSALEMNVEIFL